MPLALALMSKPVRELRLVLSSKSSVVGQDSQEGRFKAAHLCVLGSRVQLNG